MDSQHTVTQSNILERVTALLEHQERRASRFYVTVGLSVASLMISSVLIWQLAEYRTERRADTATRIAYEAATQNVINRYMGQNEGRAQAIIIGAVEYRINQDIPRPDPGDDESITVLLFSGAVADAMGRLAGMEAEFGAVYQPEIDAFASAADAVVAG